MYFDRVEFHDKCNKILDDIESQKPHSSAWTWMAVGAIGGLLLSCLKMKRPSGRPILASMKKPKIGE